MRFMMYFAIILLLAAVPHCALIPQGNPDPVSTYYQSQDSPNALKNTGTCTAGPSEYHTHSSGNKSKKVI